MYSTKLDNYKAFNDINLREVMSILENSEDKILLIIDKKNKLIGTITDGDIRRYFIKNNNNSLNDNVTNATNLNYTYRFKNDLNTNEFVDLKHKIIPVIDKNKILIGVLKSQYNKIDIGEFEIGSNHKTFIIAEVGNNHNGSLKNAFKMIDMCVEMGVDCVKFQLRNLNDLYRKNTINKNGEDLGTEYLIDILNKFELSLEEHKKVRDYCIKKNILYLCTPWDLKSVDVLEEFEVPAYKIASADLTNRLLIDKLIKTNKPLIFSTGMSTRDEINNLVNYLNKQNAKFVILHCNSTYPAPFQDINLNWLKQLKKIHPIIGYSGHERGIAVSLAAVTLGASVIERHFTLDRNWEGNDHAASLEFEEFSNLVSGIREIELSLGTEKEKVISQGEIINRENLSKSLVSAVNIKKGTVLKKEHIIVKSPGQGLSPLFIDKLLGKTLQRDMGIEDFFFMSDIKEQIIKPQNYSFDLDWGIPVRYHDFKTFNDLIKPDLFEFHLSYSDLDLEIDSFIDINKEMQFVVHAPELFANSRLLDLASSDENYRVSSVNEMKRVISITKKLNSYFPSTKKPLIVTNIGGFSRDIPMSKDEKKIAYDIFAKSLEELKDDKVEIIPQTMPPFPWHFGGQRLQNLFIDPDEILYWCNKLNLRMCFDISHSFLACNHFNLDFQEFTKKLAPLTAHLHIGDAKGLNGEGLQIGDGEIDFELFSKNFKFINKEASFIPEIWQGHKNNGEGFWIALNKLKKLL